MSELKSQALDRALQRSTVRREEPILSCGTVDFELGRLRWRCRRGMKELDILLERYLEQGYLRADRAEQSAFARLLAASDPELAAWLIYGRPCPDPQLTKIIAVLRNCPLRVIAR